MSDISAPETSVQTDLGADFPTDQTVLTLNGGQTRIALPQAGSLWVVALGDPPEQLYLWHQGGTTEQIPMNEPVSFQVAVQDALVYQLPASNFKLVWAYA
jgi:hypothetical protein